MFNSIFDSFNSSIDVMIFIVSIIFGFIIALVHKKTARSSKNFLITVCSYLY